MHENAPHATRGVDMRKMFIFPCLKHQGKIPRSAKSIPTQELPHTAQELFN